MKISSIIVFFLISFFGLKAQERDDLKEPKLLAELLTMEANSELDKVESIFYWITDNIEYDIETYNKVGSKYPEFEFEITEDSLENIRSYNYEVSKMVLGKRKAICDGYSRLFKTLCDYSGIESEVVNGIVKTPLEREPSPHAWNAVKIGDKWHLLDATWASGGLTLAENSFQKRLDSLYYLTAPEILIIDHFPENKKWTLIEENITYDEFLNSPAQSTNMFSKGMIDFFPKTNSLTTNHEGFIELWFEFDKSFSQYDISITEKNIESKADEIGVNVTKNNYDSLSNLYPDLGLRVPKIEVIDTDVSGNKIRFLIKPLTKDLKGLLVYIDSSFPSFEYEVKLK